MLRRAVSGIVFFFFKQKTAYEMRISDWSSDVCSSDLCPVERLDAQAGRPFPCRMDAARLVRPERRTDRVRATALSAPAGLRHQLYRRQIAARSCHGRLFARARRAGPAIPAARFPRRMERRRHGAAAADRKRNPAEEVT